MIDFTIHDWNIFIYHLNPGFFAVSLILFLHWILEAFFVFICRLEVENCKHWYNQLKGDAGEETSDIMADNCVLNTHI